MKAGAELLLLVLVLLELHLEVHLKTLGRPLRSEQLCQLLMGPGHVVVRVFGQGHDAWPS